MNATADVLLIEDDAVLGGAVTQRLMLEGFGVRWTRTASDALSALKRARPDFVLADIRLPDGSGEMVFRQALPFLGTTPIVFATAFADIEQAVRLVRAGADDYLTKPYDLDAVVDRIRLALGERRSEPSGPECVLPALDRIAGSDLPVLLRGETGVGKEIAARRLHALSPRASQPFVAVNCGAIARELMESQFFGHERARLHRRAVGPRRSLRGGRRGYAVPRRDRRTRCTTADRTAAGAERRDVPAGRFAARCAVSGPAGRGHQCRPGRTHRGRPVPPGPLLPARRRRAGDTAASRPACRDRAAGDGLRRGSGCPDEARDAGARRHGASGAARACLARQRPRVAQPRRSARWRSATVRRWRRPTCFRSSDWTSRYSAVWRMSGSAPSWDQIDRALALSGGPGSRRRPRS